MGTLSAEQWGCQAWLLLSKSSSRAHWGAQILQSNRRLLLEPAGDVMQLVGKGGQPIRCGPWPVSPVACRRVAWQQQADSSGRGALELCQDQGWQGMGLISWGSRACLFWEEKPWGLLESCIVEAEATWMQLLFQPSSPPEDACLLSSWLAPMQTCGCIFKGL